MLHRKWFGSRPEAVLRRLLVVLLLVLIARQWVCSLVLIRGNSMLPTLHNGQFAMVNKLAYCFHPPRRGDIVSVWTGNELWAKRIVGLPGEEIALRQGTLYVNGQVLSEPYVQVHGNVDIQTGKLEPNHFVAAGDNRDSPLIVVVKRDRIVGQLVFLRAPPLCARHWEAGKKL